MVDPKQKITAIDSLYESILNFVPVGVYIWRHYADETMGFEYVSPPFCQLLGLDAKTILEDYRCTFDIVHPDDIESLNQYNQKARESLTVFNWTGRFLVHGKVRWMRIKADPTPEADGGSLWIGAISDVTDLKTAELALQESGKTYESLFTNMLNSFAHCRMIYESDIPVDYEILRVNPAYVRVTGLKDVEGKRISEVIPGYCEQSSESLEKFDQVVKSGIPARWEHYLSLLDRWYSFMIYRPAEGEFVLISEDITERKHDEESLQQADMVFRSTGEAIVLTDADNNIIAVNPAFTEITGYNESEVIGKNPRILSSGLQDTSFYQAMWRQLNEQDRWQGEILNRRKTGEVYAEQLSINIIRSGGGKVYRHVALFSDVTEKKRTEEIIWRQANYDALTSLPNRRMFLDRFAHQLKQANRSGEKLALLFVDLDRFKDINDTLGHLVGDEMLMEAASRLKECIRETDMVSRLGGDEFTVILNHLQSVGDVDHVLQSILSRLSRPYMIGSERIFSSASIGIAVYPDDSIQPEELLKFADQAMYVAKQEGRNRYSFYTHELQETARERIHMLSELQGALASNQFRVYFQPIVELATGQVHKAEALLRWQHPNRGLVSPSTFIPLTEETGQIIEIGDWVFRESMGWVKRWNDLSNEGFQISINKSPVQFRASHHAGTSWLAYLEELGLSGHNLVIEITEGMLLNQDDQTLNKLIQYRDSGIQVSIDDFGTGYSALSYLQRFDIDYLKIDQSFVRNMAVDSSDLALCEAIVVMAHKLGLNVIAEGIETIEQRDLLTSIGCDYGQGFYFAKPMPGEEFEKLLYS